MTKKHSKLHVINVFMQIYLLIDILYKSSYFFCL